MAEWLGSLMTDWPFWAVMAAACIIGIVWIMYFTSAEWPFQKKEWWQDRQKRLEKASKPNKSKPKKG